VTDLKVVELGADSTDGTVNDLVSQINKMCEEHAVVNAAVVLITKDGYVIDGFANNHRAFALVGALEALKTRFQFAAIEAVRGDDE